MRKHKSTNEKSTAIFFLSHGEILSNSLKKTETYYMIRKYCCRFLVSRFIFSLRTYVNTLVGKLQISVEI